MDRDTYNQLVEMNIRLDELKEKMDLVLDEIDDLKKSSEEKPRGNPPIEQQSKQEKQSCEDTQEQQDVTPLFTCKKSAHFPKPPYTVPIQKYIKMEIQYVVFILTPFVSALFVFKVQKSAES